MEYYSDMEFEVDDFVFSNKKKIGTGTFGRVYKVNVRTSSSQKDLGKFALKVLDDRHDPEPKLMRRLGHPNVITLIHRFKRRGRVNVLYELMEDGDLLKFLRQHYSDPEGLGIYTEVFAFQLFRGLAYLASKRVVHLDIKSENLLVSRARGTLKIADFGCGRFIPDGRWQSHSVGTLLFNPPEILMRTALCSHSADVWAAGVVLSEMVLNRPLFSSWAKGERMQLRNIEKVLGPWTRADCAKMGVEYRRPRLRRPRRSLGKVFRKLLPAGSGTHDRGALLDLLRQILRYRQDERPHPWQIMAHPFFERIISGREELPNGRDLGHLLHFTDEERADARRLRFDVPKRRKRRRRKGRRGTARERQPEE